MEYVVEMVEKPTLRIKASLFPLRNIFIMCLTQNHIGQFCVLYTVKNVPVPSMTDDDLTLAFAK